MNRLDCSLEREVLVQDHTVHPEIIETAILSFPAVIDCRVLVKECQKDAQKKSRQLVAYVISEKLFSTDKLHQFLTEHLSEPLLPVAYVRITNMPLDECGRIDDGVLQSLFVVNDTLVSAWDLRLQSLTELQHYAVIKQEKNDQYKPLHLSYLCSEWESKTGSEKPIEIEYKEGEASVIPALSDGGVLELDNTLPVTLSDALLHAQKQSDSGIVYVQQDGSDCFISYSELLFQAKKIVTGLENNKLKANDMVILQLSRLEDFVVAFWACLLAGVSPLTVAIAPSFESKNGVLDKLFNAWKLLKQPLIIADDELLAGIDSFQSLYDIKQLTRLSISQLINCPPATSWYQSQPDEIAFLQLSSGSTGVSKCIPETHRAVIAHIQAAQKVNQYQSQHISLNWLPMDHVGPLLMYHVRDVYLGIRQIQVPPNLILNDPALWLDYLQHYQVSHTWCANFGYKRINDCLLDHPHKKWDLSSVKVFCNAGEQVTLAVVRDFIRLTERFHVKPESVQPAYGMAEAATAVTFCQHFDLQQHAHHIEKASLNGSLSKVAQETTDSVTFIVQGPPSPGVKIRIVNKQNQLLTEKKIGRVQLTGETIMPGYLHNDKANAEAFCKDGWYNTGDLGFLLNGELTITGREKELIVVYGANYYCTDIEALVSDIAGVSPTFAAAIGVEAESGTEQLAIFFVPIRKDLKRNIDLLETIKTQVTLLLGINPSFVIPLSEVQFPKTTSGKIQRAQLKKNLLNGCYADILQDIDCFQRNENTLPNWFYKICWLPRQAELVQSNYPGGPYLIFLDELGLGRSLAKELRENHECILVEAGDDYAQITRHHYRIVASNSEHYHLLFTNLISHHQKITQILHLWNYKVIEEITSLAELEQTQKWVMCNFLLLIKSLIRHHDSEQVVQCHIISSDTVAISETEKSFYGRSGLTGLIKTLSKEVPWLRCCHIDLPIADKVQNAHNILREIKTISCAQEVALRQEQRFIKRYTAIEFQPTRQKNIPFKPGGMYLVSGGLGHIGLAVTQMLLERYQARLIIIGRTSFAEAIPEEEQDNGIVQKRNAIEFLQQFPGKFYYHAVDVCDQEQLESIIQCAEQQWKIELDGVIHLAGSEPKRLLKDESIDTLSQVLRPKVMGSWVLHQLLLKRAKNKADKKLFIHFSSLNSHFGSEKSGAEAAANAFLNSFSHFQNQNTTINSFCYAWSRWHESVQGRSSRIPLATDSGFYEMSQHQAISSFLVALQYQHQFLLIGLNGRSRRIRYQIEMPVTNTQEITVYFTSQSTNNSQLSYDALKALSVADCFGSLTKCNPFRIKQLPVNEQGAIDPQQLHGVQVYDSTNTEVFVSAGSEIEQQLSWIWQDILAISQPGIHDNFFKLGGNSLQATVFISRVRDIFQYDLSLQSIFKSPTIAAIAELLEKRELHQKAPIPILAKSSIALPRLSIGQERLWFLYQLAPKNPQYNVPVSVDIYGELDIILLIKSLNSLIERHESLRTCFSYRHNQSVQHIADDLKLSISITDISEPQDQQQKRLQDFIQKETLKPFDITRLPLIRVKLYRLSERHYVMLSVMHHIVTDGWSMGVFFHDLTSFYKAYKSQSKTSLLALEVQYSDFAAWQRNWLSGTRLKRQMDYWTRQLANLAVLNLLPDRPRNKTSSNQGSRHSCYINSELTKALKHLGQQQEASLFMTLLSVFMILCARYTGQDDIAIGTGIANRHRREIEPLIGFFTNTLVMRGDLSADPDFITLLQAVKKMALEAYEHQELPFGDLVDALQPQREIGQNPLVQVMFVMQNSPTPVSDIPDLEFSPYRVESGLVKMDIEVNVYEVEDGLRIETEFNRDLFDSSTIVRMFKHYQLLLNSIINNPQQVISSIPLLTAKEQQYLFSSESSESEELLSERPFIHEYVEQLAKDTPQSIAVIFEQQSLSYGKLNQKANQLAHYLCAQGVQKESLVGICIERSLEMIIALVAIFKAGAAYVPLDPAYPDNRLRFILEDTGLKVLLTQQSLKDKLPDNQAHMICIDSLWGNIEKLSNENLNSKISAHNLAYIIYTSGSTGNPKGVLIEHKGLSNLIYAQSVIFGVSKSDRVLQFSSLNFDASVFEIVMALSAGAGLVMVNQRALMFGAPLLRLLEKENITITLIPPSVLVTLPVEGKDFLPNLKTLIVGGEAASAELLGTWSHNRRIFNAYGPTEATVVASSYLCKDDKQTPPIGRALVNTKIYLLDKSGQPVPVGVPGEIHIGGIAVARGYLNRAELTAERFIPDPFSEKTDAKMYCSGDLARYLPDGNIEYLGRIDQQVKIRGFRVEPGEIENRLREHEAVKDAFIHVNKSEIQNPFLEAFVTQKVKNSEAVIELSSILKAYLKEQLPPHMIPSSINVIDRIPLTANGKLDYTQLATLQTNQRKEPAAPEVTTSVSEVLEDRDDTQIETVIIKVIADKLHLQQVGIHSHFFDELGANSLGMVHIHKELEKHLSQEISLIDLFEYPTIAQLTQYLSKGPVGSVRSQLLQKKMPERVNKQQVEAIAIIGMAGRFPGASSVDEFWEKIKQGKELIQQFTEEELLQAGIDKTLLEDPNYVRSKGALEGVETFDADFFNFTPKEAIITDPQQRLFLETTWEAFEHAGYDPYNYPGTVGIMGGLGSSNTYYQKNLQFSDFGQDVIGDYQLSLNNSADFLCTRVAYKLNLQGSAATIQSACSTSLVPSIMGYQSLINYQTDLIVAGGSAITLPAKSGYMYEEGMILSPDGHCRTFDAAAQGTVPGNAAGVVLLKRLEDAIRDGDTIYATIRGAAFNNDGDRKVGFTASGLDGQTRVIREALQTANVSPESISYVEAHGTATPLGDPIEIRALTKAWYTNVEQQKKGYCAIGSVKTNIGHCDAAAGVSGLIKTVCSLYHKQIAPSLHFQNANRQIDFSNSPFYVNTELSEWKTDGVFRRAAVSSFGMGGTNAHVILEEAPQKEASALGRDWLLFVSSAKTSTALKTMQERLLHHLKNHSEQNPADIAYTGQVGRHAYKYRQIIVCQNQRKQINALSVDDHQKSVKGEVLSEKTPEIIFLFPGQGAQYLNMGRDLYHSESVFREHLDRCAEILKPLLEQDIREILYPAEDQNNAINTNRLNQTENAQPILLAIEYALAELLISWGIRPAMLAGHSLGEYTAACVAGVMTLEECLKMVSLRARLMQSMPIGSMLAVPLSEAAIQPYLKSGLDLAAVNTPERCVVSGENEQIELLQTTLQSQGIETRRLHTSHAYHSSMMDPMLSTFYELLADIEFKTPVIPLISSTNAKPVQLMDSAYWSSQIRETVRFSDVLSQVYQIADSLVLEVGPGNTLSSFARAHSEKPAKTPIYNTLRHPRENQNDNAYLLLTLGKLWIAGVTPDWSGFYQKEQRYRVAIPTYPFERKRYWVDAPAQSDKSRTPGVLNKKNEIKDWFYVPTWKRSELMIMEQQAFRKIFKKTSTWLIFMDEKGIGEQFVEVLLQHKQEIIKVKKGDGFLQQNNDFEINPEQKTDYDLLIDSLIATKQNFHAIIHCWTLSDSEHGFLDEELFQQYQQSGLHSLLFLLQAMEKLSRTQELDLMLMTSQVFKVSGYEELEPAKATIIGAIKVIPQEYPHIRCIHNDIVLSDWENNEINNIANYSLAELKQNTQVVAYRNRYRWLQIYESVQLPSSDQVSLLKPQGVYFISGGLGGIGLALAHYLADAFQAKLVLLSRKIIPEKHLWSSWLQTHEEQDRISRSIRKLEQIEALGGEVLVLSVDVTDIEQMQDALKQTIEKFGAVNGVIHAAGVAGIEMIQSMTKQSIVNNLAAKVQGTRVLDTVFKSISLDFMLLCSSLSTVLGGLGLSAYCAANAFLDSFAQQQQMQHKSRVISIDWEGWSEVGMAVDNALILSKIHDLGLLTTEGVEVFRRVLNHKFPQVIISTADVNLRLEQNSRKIMTKDEPAAKESIQTRVIETSYRRPETLIEQTIAKIWQENLGIAQLGSDDDFFELGGDSLTAVQLIPKLKKALNVELSPHSLIHFPTIKALADFISQQKFALSEEQSLSPLLVELKSGKSTAAPIFLIHPVGGSVYIYRDLANSLKTNHRIYGIQAKGWDGKEAPLKTIAEMASHYTEIIRQVQPQGPYRIGGASLGGVIAFEMAQQLLSEGQTMDLLFMMDTPGTGHMPKDVFNTDLDILLYLLNISCDSDREFDKQIKTRQGDEQLQFFIDEQNKTNGQLFPDIEELRHFLMLFKVNAEALQLYQSKVYPGSIVFFVAREKDDFNAKNPQQAWSEIALGGIDVIAVDGNHITMNQSPNVNIIARRLEDELNKF